MFNTLIDPRELTEKEDVLESDLILQVQNNQGGHENDMEDWETTTEAEFL